MCTSVCFVPGNVWDCPVVLTIHTWLVLEPLLMPHNSCLHSGWDVLEPLHFFHAGNSYVELAGVCNELRYAPARPLLEQQTLLGVKHKAVDCSCTAEHRFQVPCRLSGLGAAQTDLRIRRGAELSLCSNPEEWMALRFAQYSTLGDPSLSRSSRTSNSSSSSSAGRLALVVMELCQMVVQDGDRRTEFA